MYPGERPEDIFDGSGQVAKSLDVSRFVFRIDIRLSGDPHFHRKLDRIRLQLMKRHVRARHFLAHGGLQRSDESGSGFFVAQPNQDQCIVALRQFGSGGIPEARPAATHERRERFEKLPGFLGRVGARILAGNAPHDGFDAGRGFIRGGERRVIRQPDVNVRPVLDVIGKKLALQFGSDDHARCEKEQRYADHGPSPADRTSCASL